MEEYAVILFSMEGSRAGRRSRREPWSYEIARKEYPAGDDRLILIRVVLPGLGTRRKAWKPEEKTAYLSGICLPEEGRNVCYLYEKAADAFLGRSWEPLSMEWSLFLLRWFLNSNLSARSKCLSVPAAGGSVFYRKAALPALDALLLVENRLLDPEEWVYLFAARTRYIAILTEKPKQWEPLQEKMYEEYGFCPEISRELDGLHLPDKDKSLLIVSGESGGKIKPVYIQHHGIWLCTAAGDTAAKRIASRLNHVCYLDAEVLWKSLTGEASLASVDRGECKE